MSAQGATPAMAYRTRKGRYECGVCGSVAKMSKAHVPPQCSGNTEEVTRSRWLAHNGRVEHGRDETGGIWFKGICRKCNTAAGKFDGAYATLADALRPFWEASLTQIAVTVSGVPVPNVSIYPGAVGRSVLLGMCATTPMIRRNWPRVNHLLSGRPVALPRDYRLYLAVAQGRSAWVSGTTAGHYTDHRGGSDEPQVVMSMSSIFFPPLAWQLVAADARQPDGWADVSSWLAYDSTEQMELGALVSQLVFDCHPRHNPGGDRDWIDHLQTDVSAVIESFDITNSDPNIIAVRRRRMERQMVPMEEVEAVLRAQGYSFPGSADADTPN